MPFRQQKSRKKETAPAAQAALKYEGLAPLDRPESDFLVDPWAVALLVATCFVLWTALVVGTDLAAGPKPPPHAADVSAASQSPEGVAR